MTKPGAIATSEAIRSGAVAGAVATILLFAPAMPAWAGGIVAASIGTASAQVLAAAPGVGRRYLVIDNESATIACAFGGAAALNTAGSWTIAPGGRLALGVGYGVSFQDSLDCIASADSTPATILWE
jgi:hypothetical protein